MDRNCGEDTATTSKVCKFFNDLFNSVNSDKEDPYNKLRSPVTKDSCHLEFWRTAKKAESNKNS